MRATAIAHRSFALLLVTSLLSGCPGALEDPERFLGDAGSEDGPCFDVPAYLRESCTGSLCHSTSPSRLPGPAAGLDLEAPDLAARVRLVAAGLGPGAGGAGGAGAGGAGGAGGDAGAGGEEGASDSVCEGILADPEAPEQSLLVRKLGASPPCGDPMPLFQDPLSAGQRRCVEEWIRGL